MVQLISIILAFLIIYTLFKTRETSSSSRKLRMLVYTFFWDNFSIRFSKCRTRNLWAAEFL